MNTKLLKYYYNHCLQHVEESTSDHGHGDLLRANTAGTSYFT